MSFPKCKYVSPNTTKKSRKYNKLYHVLLTKARYNHIGVQILKYYTK
jgi:hypothetical protein